MKLPHVVKIGKSIFVGGGLSHIIDNTHFVMKYDLDISQWSVLPKCPTRGFGLAQFDEQLFTIGGSYGKGLPSDQVLSFCDEEKTWKKELPPLQTSRGFPSVVSCDSCIIVVGGVTDWGTEGTGTTASLTNTVEIFDKTSGKWRYTCPLPFEGNAMTSCIFQDKCFVGNRCTNRLVCISLSSLIRESHTEYPFCKWASIDRVLPLYLSTLCIVQSSIVCIGGVRDATVTSYIGSSFIYKFDLLRQRWSKHAVQLPERRCHVGAIELDDGEVLVLGGEEKDGVIRASVFRGSL